MSVKLLIEHHLEFLSLTGGYTGSSESIHVKMPHCWISHVAAQKVFNSFKHEARFLLFFFDKIYHRRGPYICINSPINVKNL